MTRGSLSLSLLALACILESQSAWAIDACEAVRQSISASAGQLINLSTRTILDQFNAGPAKRTSDLRLAYVVPNSSDQTGALVVKVRHQLPKEASARTGEGFPGGDYIRLQRAAHLAPCSNQWRKTYDTSVRLEHYVDQHYYGITYPSMDEFHAEVGYRKRRVSIAGFGFDRRVCKNTYDAETRPYFLYSDNPRIATYGESALRRSAKLAKQVSFINEAFADEAPRYRDKLNTIIVPYARTNTTADNCVSFSVSVPDKAGRTDIEVIDADKFGMRGTWQVPWEQN